MGQFYPLTLFAEVECVIPESHLRGVEAQLVCRRGKMGDTSPQPTPRGGREVSGGVGVGWEAVPPPRVAQLLLSPSLGGL